MPEIIVGIDASPGSEDALAFARRLAGATGAALRLASAYPYVELAGRAASPEFGELLRGDTLSLLERMRSTLGDDTIPVHAIADPSPARTLQLLADQVSAALIVVGSTHRGPVGRVFPGSTGDRLLHGAPCAVAIVPHGYGARADAPFRTIGVGYDGGEESKAALAAACEAARRFGAALRVVGVFDALLVGTPALMSGPGYIAVRDEVEQRLRDQLESAVARLPADVSAESVFLSGHPFRELAAQSEDVDLMLLGSRGYGPLCAVLLGGVSHGVVRHAACPVMVLPRGAGLKLAELFAPAAASTAG